MKKILFLLAGAAMMFVSSCSSKSEQATTDESQQSAVEETVPAVSFAKPTGEVQSLTEVGPYVPGVKPDVLTIIDFNAVWCGPCRQFSPVFEAAAKEYKDRAVFLSVDVDVLGSMMDSFQLGGSIPCVLFIHPDGTTEKYVGLGDLMPQEKFFALIDKNLE